MFYWGFLIFMPPAPEGGLFSLHSIFRRFDDKSYYNLTTVTTAPFSHFSPLVPANPCRNHPDPADGSTKPTHSIYPLETVEPGFGSSPVFAGLKVKSMPQAGRKILVGPIDLRDKRTAVTIRILVPKTRVQCLKELGTLALPKDKDS